MKIGFLGRLEVKAIEVTERERERERKRVRVREIYFWVILNVRKAIAIPFLDLKIEK